MGNSFIARVSDVRLRQLFVYLLEQQTLSLGSMLIARRCPGNADAAGAALGESGFAFLEDNATLNDVQDVDTTALKIFFNQWLGVDFYELLPMLLDATQRQFNVVGSILFGAEA